MRPPDEPHGRALTAHARVPRPDRLARIARCAGLLVLFSTSCARSHDEARRLPEDERSDAGPDTCGCHDGAGCVGGVCTSASGWHTSGRLAIGDAVACRLRQRIAVRCPPQHEVGGSVWGSDVYTDDSSVCQAAVHAGRITTAAGGDVLIEVSAGQKAYRGAERNGVTGHAFGPWRCSFVVLGDRCVPGLATCAGACADLRTDASHCGSCGHACGPDESCTRGACVPGVDASPSTTAARFACTLGATHVVRCPTLPLTSPLPPVYGTGTYAADSSICAAAVHDGRLGRAGGTVWIELTAGYRAYRGSGAHGVVSADATTSTCSFVFR